MKVLKVLGMSVVGLCVASCACEREEPAQNQEPSKEEPETPLPRVQPDGGPGVGTPTQDMAGNFEGRAHVVLKRPEGEVDLTLISKDQRSRLQVNDSKHPERRLDLVFDDDQAAVLLNDKKQYFNVDLDKLKEKPEESIEVRETSSSGDARKTVRGLNCNIKELTQPGQKISACVLGLPNGFDADDFEALTGIDLPPWVEYLFERDLWPVTATVRDEAGKDLYSVEVLDYTSRPLPEAQELAVPPDFARIEPRLPVLR
jgi:hypothetical protein